MEFPCHPCDPTGPRAEQRKAQPPPSTGGVDSIRRGKAPPLAVFGDFLAAESHPSGASPAGALVSAWEIGEEHPLSLPNGRNRNPIGERPHQAGGLE